MTQHISYNRGETDTRPWGDWEVLDVGENYIVKRIRVAPGKRLSLQKHRYRSEHWLIVEGEGLVTLDDKELAAKGNQHIFIPCGARHRIHNTSDNVLIFIEIQQGERLEEDDIIRLEDDFDRA